MKAKKIQESLKRGGEPFDTMGVGKNTEEYRSKVKRSITHISTDAWDDATHNMHRELFYYFIQAVLRKASIYKIDPADVLLAFFERDDEFGDGGGMEHYGIQLREALGEWKDEMRENASEFMQAMAKLGPMKIREVYDKGEWR